MTTTATPVRGQEEWLSVRAACALIGVSPATLRRWSNAGVIATFTTPGGHRRFARSAVLDLLPRDAGTGTAPAAREEPRPAESRASLAPAVVALVAHARDVPSEEREAFADRIEAQGVSEGMILVRTCHRTELYATPAALAARPAPDPPPGTRHLTDADAVRHLIALGCGLESAILGEDQVLGQLRDALADRRSAGALDPVLGRLFQVALHAGRRAHAWLRGMHRSLGEVAVERALGDTTGTLLVVGAGSMGRLTALAAGRHGVDVVIANRTPMRATTLARDVGGGTAAFPGSEALDDVAGIVVAVSGPWDVDAATEARVLASGVRVVDLSSPPAVSAGLRQALGERYTSIDDLSWNQGVELPPSLVARLERLVSESGGEFCSWLRTRDAVPAIQAMSRAAEERRREELEWLTRRLPDLSDEERAAIAQMTNRLVAGLLHGPRSALASDPSGDLGRAALELFGA